MRKTRLLPASLLCLTMSALLSLSPGLPLFSRAAADDAKGAGDKTEPAPDKQLIQGDWKVVAMVRDGEAVSDQELQDDPMSAKFEGDTFTLSKGENKSEADFSLDASKNPRQITVTPRSGAGKGKARISIYELNGDSLKLAFRLGGAADSPPADFTHAEGVA